MLNATGNVVTEESLPGFIAAAGEAGVESAPVSSTGGSAATETTPPPKVSPAPSDENSAYDLPSPENSREAGAADTLGTVAETGSALPQEWSLAEFIQQRLEAGTEDLYSEVMECVEKELFARVLQETRGNQSKTATILGITRGKVRDRISSYKITVDPSVNVNS